MRTRAPNLTTSNTVFAVEASWEGLRYDEASGRHKSLVNRVATPIDSMAAGTGALIAIAAAGKLTNCDG
ncbi:hypothetical protein ATN79_44845 [Paraburkholderia caribensis]|nr:hypothetical protein ATN79_44845 [Paraburkholderia caribensis]